MTEIWPIDDDLEDRVKAYSITCSGTDKKPSHPVTVYEIPKYDTNGKQVPYNCDDCKNGE